jgi:nucleoside-diphosphate-sugar epimerase
MQTVLVAGGAGFIGSNLCKNLLNTNYKVIAIDNLITGDENNIKEFIPSSNFKFINLDVSDRNFSFDEKVDFILHLASPASPNSESPKSYMAFPVETLLANSMGTYNLLEVALKNNAKFLFASSSEVYGDPEFSPQPETYSGNVSPNGPRSVYDEGKRFGEAMTFAYFRKFGLDARVVRIFNTYGPNMRADDGRVVSNFINQAIKNETITIYGEGTQTRSFCFVEDMVDGLEKALFSNKTSGEVFNLGNPDERKIIDFAELVKSLSNSTSNIEKTRGLPADDPKRRCPDITKAKNILKWEPKIPLEEGLEKTIQYFKSL